MSVIWAIVVAMIVLVLALFLYHLVVVIIEEAHIFKALIGIFFLFYIGAALVIWRLSPPLDQPASVSVLAGTVFFTLNEGLVNP